MTHCGVPQARGAAERARGLPVMRFDWSCTGDSEGDVYDGTVAQWVEDVETAADELRDAAGVRRVSIIGMRLGALLAAQGGRAGRRSERAAALGARLPRAPTTSPISSGSTTTSRRAASTASSKPRVELAGYPFPSALRASIAALELKEHLPKSAGRVSMFLKAEQPEADDVVTTWKRAGLKVDSQVVREESGGVTEGAGEGDSAVLYTHMLTAMASELTQGEGAGGGGMKEHAVSFGAAGNLAGILCEARQPVGGAPLALMWNVGIHHRVGAYRIWVRPRAQAGGRGLLEPAVRSLGQWATATRGAARKKTRTRAVDLDEAMGSRRGARAIATFAPIGFCSGIDQLHALGLRDPRVVAMGYVEGYAWKTRGYYMRYPLRYLRGTLWRDRLEHLSERKQLQVLKGLFGKTRGARARPGRR